MQEKTGQFKGVAGGAIFWRAWLPEGDVRAVVLLAHGLAEHSGRYEHVARRLTEAGYAVYATDHMGHGRSEGDRSYIDRLDSAVADLHKLSHDADHAHPGVPQFLLGHSLGGAIAIKYALAHQSELKGLALSAPAVALDAPGAQVVIGKLISGVAPRLPFLQLDGTAVSRDPKVVERYDSDPLNYRGKVPIRTATEIISVAESAKSELPKLKLPLLVMQGTADRLVAPRAAKLVGDHAGSADKTVKTYEGLYHEILNEPEQDQVISDLRAWLEART